jgi:hypothetical protein
MSFALPFARSGSNELSETRLAGLGLAAISLLLFALAALSPHVLGDGDTWSHVATGGWIIAHGAVPRGDPFSQSMAGEPWTAHEWLSELLLSLAFRLGGWSGVVLLTGAAVALAVLIVGLSTAHELRGVPLIATVAIGLSLLTTNLLARPHVLALPLAAAWCAGLIATRDRGRAPPLGLVALMTAWANMHGGFIFGLILIGPFALEAATEAPIGARLVAARAWATFAVAVLAAAFINPYGIDAFLLPFRLMSVESLSRISEWRPQDFSHIGTMELALLTLLGLTLTRPFAMPADPRHLADRAGGDGATAFTPSGVARDPRADAPGAPDRGGDRRRERRRRMAAGRPHRAAGDSRRSDGDRRRQAHDADPVGRRGQRADLGFERRPAGVEKEARAERLCLWRFSYL